MIFGGFLEVSNQTMKASALVIDALHLEVELIDNLSIEDNITLPVKYVTFVKTNSNSKHDFTLSADTALLDAINAIIEDVSLNYKLYAVEELTRVKYLIYEDTLIVTDYRIDKGASSISVEIVSDIDVVDPIGSNIDISANIIQKVKDVDSVGGESYEYTINPKVYRDIGIGSEVDDSIVVSTITSKSLVLNDEGYNLTLRGEV